tara:strand:- start:235 stop:624 length:390 start_codon:yes stop_codon:yes gene_type:complete
LKLKFNPNLDYQQDAIESTLSVFEGLSTAGEPYRKLGIANTLALDPDKLLDNLHRVQEQNFIEKSPGLFEDGDDYPFPNFSVEMETGTGKMASWPAGLKMPTKNWLPAHYSATCPNGRWSRYMMAISPR